MPPVFAALQNGFCVLNKLCAAVFAALFPSWQLLPLHLKWFIIDFFAQRRGLSHSAFRARVLSSVRKAFSPWAVLTEKSSDIDESQKNYIFCNFSLAFSEEIWYYI